MLHSTSIQMLLLLISVSKIKSIDSTFQFAEQDEILAWDMHVTFQLQVDVRKIIHKEEDNAEK